jgi:hypothetical protein
MGSGGGDQLILAEDDEHDDEIRRGARGLGDLGGLGSMSPADEDDDDDDDAEELLMRLQEQNERSWSRSVLYPSCPPPALVLLLSVSERASVGRWSCALSRSRVHAL